MFASIGYVFYAIASLFDETSEEKCEGEKHTYECVMYDYNSPLRLCEIMKR